MHDIRFAAMERMVWKDNDYYLFEVIWDRITVRLFKTRFFLLHLQCCIPARNPKKKKKKK